MSTYGLASADHHQFANNFDKVAAYHNALQNNKANFSVSHLLDLEELPSENCAMYANTDPQPGLPTQACTPTLTGNPAGTGMTDLSHNSPSPIQERMQQPSPGDTKSQSEFGVPLFQYLSFFVDIVREYIFCGSWKYVSFYHKMLDNNVEIILINLW